MTTTFTCILDLFMLHHEAFYFFCAYVLLWLVGMGRYTYLPIRYCHNFFFKEKLILQILWLGMGQNNRFTYHKFFYLRVITFFFFTLALLYFIPCLYTRQRKVTSFSSAEGSVLYQWVLHDVISFISEVNTRKWKMADGMTTKDIRPAPSHFKSREWWIQKHDSHCGAALHHLH